MKELLVSGLLMETAVSYDKLRLHRMGYFADPMPSSDDISDNIPNLVRGKRPRSSPPAVAL
jgi:hypothetical protein